MNIDKLRKNGELPPSEPLIEEKQYLTFLLNHELFAVVIHSVKEIIEYPGVTEVPLMPSFMHGVINMRGAVVPVIDLSIRFGKGASQIGRRSCVIIMEVHFADEWHKIGILVDAVNEVLEIPAQQIEPAPEFGAKVRSEFIAGIGKINDKFVVILDVSNALSLDELNSIIAEENQQASNPFQETTELSP